MEIDGVTGVGLTTTSLMDLPVDRPYFYMTPSEFDLLPYVKRVSCRVVMRNPRTAFETNSTETTLATLNQNKFACFATGLLTKTGGVNREISFSSTNKAMDSSGTTEMNISERAGVATNMYGGNMHHRQIIPGYQYLPHSQLGLPFHLNNYFCLVRDSKAEPSCGWPQLLPHITKADASFLVGKTVMDYSYSPKRGLLTEPYDIVKTRWLTNRNTRDHTYSSTQFGSIAMQSPRAVASYFVFVNSSGHVNENFVQMAKLTHDTWTTITSEHPYYVPIEKCQYIKKGLNGQFGGQIQPSAHVGIYPVPRLTTTDLNDVSNQFTDVQVQWDVDCEIEIGWYYPHHTMSYEHFHIPAEDGYYVHQYTAEYACARPCFQENRSTFNGLYTSLVRAATTATAAPEAAPMETETQAATPQPLPPEVPPAAVQQPRQPLPVARNNNIRAHR